MKVKCTRSRCLLEGCVKDNYYARFHLHSYHCCREMNFISRLDVNFPDSTQNIEKSLEREMKVKGTGSRCRDFPRPILGPNIGPYSQSKNEVFFPNMRKNSQIIKKK